MDFENLLKGVLLLAAFIIALQVITRKRRSQAMPDESSPIENMARFDPLLNNYGGQESCTPRDHGCAADNSQPEVAGGNLSGVHHIS